MYPDGWVPSVPNFDLCYVIPKTALNIAEWGANSWMSPSPIISATTKNIESVIDAPTVEGAKSIFQQFPWLSERPIVENVNAGWTAPFIPSSPRYVKQETDSSSSSEEEEFLDSGIALMKNGGALHLPSDNIQQPPANGRFTIWRGEVCPNTLKGRLIGLFNSKPIKLLIDTEVSKQSNPTPAAYVVCLGNGNTTLPMNYSNLYSLLSGIEKVIRTPDSKGHFVNIELAPYIMVKYKRNPRVVVSEKFNFIKDGHIEVLPPCKVCNRAFDRNSHLCNCKRCGIPFESGKRHKCDKSEAGIERAKMSEFSKKSEEEKQKHFESKSSSDEKALSSSDQKRKDQEKKLVKELKVIGEKLITSHPSNPNHILNPKTSPSSSTFSSPPTFSFPTEPSTTSTCSTVQHDETKTNAITAPQVTEHLKEKYENPTLPVPSGEGSVQNFKYRTPIGRVFGIEFPRTLPEIISLIRQILTSRWAWALLCLLVSMFVESFFWFPISRLCFEARPSTVWGILSEYVYGRSYYYTYWGTLNYLAWIVCFILAIFHSGNSLSRLISNFVSPNLVLTREIEFISKMEQLPGDQRAQINKVGSVKQVDPDIWQVRVNELIWNATNEYSGITERGIFFSTSSRILHVSMALYANTVHLRTLNSVDTVSELQTRIKNAINTCSSVNIPASLAYTGASVHSDTMTYAMHVLQTIRPDVDVFTPC